MASPAGPHVLVVTRDHDTALAPDIWVECPGVTDDCRAWLECHADGCDVDELDRLAYEDGFDDPVLHGERHRDTGGWSVPTDDCFIVWHPDLADAARDLWPDGQPAPAGRHLIVLDYDADDDPGTLRLRFGRPYERLVVDEHAFAALGLL